MRRLVLSFLFVTVALGALGCSNVRTIAVSTEPNGAELSIDEEPVGVTPLDYPFDFDKKKSFKLYARAEGHVENFVTVSEAFLGEKTAISIRLDRDEAWHATTESGGTNEWLNVEINPRLSREDVWTRLVAVVKKFYPNIDQLDKESGYIVTKHKQETFQRGLETMKIRTQFVASIASPKPLIYEVKIVSEASTRGRYTPYSRVFTEDAELMSEIQQELGVQN